ncbi:MAG TPA: plastocyanin/azurin family copper-binding protein [Solirubrobacterales bacterium]|nr:plastocyanin/azurin family copper-binding protein [Solirubrobacterales bacterium]
MKKFAALFALVLAALALVACGGGSDTSSSEETAGGQTETTQEEKEGGKEAEGGSAGSGSAVDVEADPSGNLAFTSDTATAEAGKATINFTNDSPVPHDVKIEDENGEEIGGTEVISEGSDSAEVELEPGTYTYYCSIPGHRQAGMEGTLTVK